MILAFSAQATIAKESSPITLSCLLVRFSAQNSNLSSLCCSNEWHKSNSTGYY